MTREEMWKEFENQLIRETRTPITESYDVSERMIKSAIEETVAKWKERLEQEPCNDAISRQAAIDCLNADFTIDGKENMETVVDYINGAFKQIKALPSVTPKPKVGKWIRIDKDKLKCSECEVIHYIAKYPQSANINYCPNCRTKMEEEECRFYPKCDHMTQDDMTELTIKDLETLEQEPI